ncbi:MAG: carboxypeptidase regulatory-like domain-containing protein [Elusimicrobiales bacterium]|nr:carboxypeptidase regulatory-like domain-containing protein [Elusimicrobiales bacterium]
MEIMIAMALLSIGVLGMIGSFTYLNKGLQVTKGRTLANNLAQEKIELLKNKSYYGVLVTTETADDDHFDPVIPYDAYPNGMENINVGGINFERRVYVRKVAEDGSGNLTYFTWNQPDTGLKEIEVYVSWREGSDWKKLKLTNIRENPDRSYLSASFDGKVVDDDFPANELEDVTVKVIENPSRSETTEADGTYGFAIEPGSYTLRASKDGYFPALSPYQSVEAGGTPTVNFTLIKMSTGSISGRVYMSDHMVIYMVVASTIMASGDDVEFVVLYNPTTSQINLLTDPTDSTSNNIKLGCYGQTGEGTDIDEVWLTHTSTYVPAGHYYLISSVGTFIFKGVSVTADAVYSAANSPPCSNLGTSLDCIRKNKAGAIRIKDVDDNVIDTLGWSNTGAGKPAPYYETTAKAMANGLLEGGQFFRFTAPGSGSSSSGNCYDTDVNTSNFFSFAPSIFKIMNIASGYKAPVTGSPAKGAFVYADDGVSDSAVVDSAGDFDLVDVATGSWTVYISSNTLFLSTGTFGGLNSGFTNSMTVRLDSTTTLGYIVGTVTDITGTPIEDIDVYGSGSLNPAPTDSNGKYILGLDPDTVVVTANYQLDNSNYIEAFETDVIVTQGAITSGVDFVLTQGGSIYGRVVTTGGVDPLPKTPIVVYKISIAQGDGITDEDGYFQIMGISSGTYSVEPQLEAGESYSPSISTSVNANDSLFIGTFTVSGAMGYIKGNVKSGGEIIDTGVLIYASTDTIASTPPTLNAALRSGTVIYYAVSSNFDGTYTLPVRGGYTYNIYAWYTTWSGSTPTTGRDEHEGVDAIAVSAGQTVERDFNW